MISHQLVRENNHAVVDAIHRSALLPLESIQRISQWAVGSGREMLSSEFALDPAALAGIPTTSFGMLGRRGLDGYRYCLEVSVDSYAKWLDLCEEYWHQAHQRMDTSLHHLQRYAPPQTSFAFFSAERAGDLAEMTVDCVADSSKAAAVEVLSEISSTFPEKKKPAKKSRSRSTAEI